MAIPTTQRLLRTLFRRASTIFTGPRSSQRWRTYTSTPQPAKPSPSQQHQHQHQQHTHHQQSTRQQTHHLPPNHQPSMWSSITLRAVMAVTTATRPKPQVVTTIRCYSKRLEESPHSSSSSSTPSPTTSPHGSKRRWSPLLGLIPMTFVSSSQNDEDDKMLQGSGPTSTSGSPSMTSMTSSPSQRWRGRTGSSPLDFVRMRLRDMTPDEDDHDISPQTSPILPIRGYDKTHTWQRHGKVGTLQFELEDEDEMTPPSHVLTPITPPVGTPSTSYFASRVDSDGRLVVRPADVSTLQAWHNLSSFLSSSSHVTSLRLQGMVLSAAHVALLGNDVLRHIHNLTFVDNNLGITDTLQSLITILKSYPQLESLSLIRQSLTDDHIILLLPIMTTHAMTHVSLAWNGIGDEGAKRLSLVLRQAQSICKMDLSYNVIGPRGSDALSLIQQQIHRLGRILSINLKQNYRHSESPPIKREEKLGWGMHTTSIHASTASMGMGSVTASEMLGVMASDITTSVIPRSQPIAIPTPSQSTSSFERHFLSGMSLH